MKPWQHGYELDYLLGLEKSWLDHNSMISSPFLRMKKNKIALALHRNQYHHSDDLCMQRRIAKIPLKIFPYYGSIRPMARIENGDLVISRLTYKSPKVAIGYLSSQTLPTYIFINQYCDDQISVAQDSNFEYIGSKINSFGDIQGAWYKGPKRDHPRISPIDNLVFSKASVKNFADLSEQIARKVDQISLGYTNHPSNYNNKKSWSALSLRGYSHDPQSIVEGELDYPVDTYLRKQFPELLKVLSLIPGKYHRIRLMSLSPDGGLGKHTDQEDKNIGVDNGCVMRFHFPLRTNPGVSFRMWDHSGLAHDFKMKLGDLWYVDIRKPHEAVNTGDTERLHLVVDVEASESLRKLVLNLSRSN